MTRLGSTEMVIRFGLDSDVDLWRMAQAAGLDRNPRSGWDEDQQAVIRRVMILRAAGFSTERAGQIAATIPMTWRTGWAVVLHDSSGAPVRHIEDALDLYRFRGLITSIPLAAS